MPPAPQALQGPPPRAGLSPQQSPPDQAAPPAGGGEAAATARVRQGLELAGLVVAPPTLLTALAFYFGWTLTSARSLHFGIDPSVLGYTTQDYLLRSTDALFLPLAALVVLALGVVGVHTVTKTLLTRDHARRALHRATVAAMVAGTVAVGYGLAAVFWSPSGTGHLLLQPLAPGAGAALIAYAVWIRRHLYARPETARPHFAPATLVLVGLLIVLSLFWATSEYAEALGRGRGAALERALQSRPEAIVTTTRPLVAAGSPGVTETRLPRSGGQPAYRYEGLRLLVRSGGNWFLVPDGWTRRDGVAVMLAEEDVELVEFRPGP